MWLVAGRAMTALAALAALRISTSVLSPHEYGLFAILLTLQNFCGLFLVNPIGQYVNRHTHQWHDDGTLIRRLPRYRQYVLACSALGSLACVAWAAMHSLPLRSIAILAVTVGITVFISTWNTIIVSMLNMVGHRLESVLWACVSAVAGIMISWLITHRFPSGAAWYAGQACGYAIGLVGANRALRSQLHSALMQHPMPLLAPGAIRQYVAPLAAATGLLWLLFSGNRLLIEFHWGLAALGTIAVSLVLASQMWSVCETLAMQYLFPMYYRRITAASREDGSSAFSDLLNSLGPAYLILGATFQICAPSLLLLLTSASYANASKIAFLAIILECGRVITNLLGAATQVELQMRANILPYATGAVVQVTGLVVAAKLGGDIHLAMLVLVASSVVTCALMARSARNLVSFKIDTWRWMAAAGILTSASALTYLHPIVPTSGGQALLLVAAAAAGSLLLIGGILWKNSGLIRMLDVRLRPVDRVHSS